MLWLIHVCVLFFLDRASPVVSSCELMTGLVVFWDGTQKVVSLMCHNTQRPKVGTCRGPGSRIKRVSWFSAGTGDLHWVRVETSCGWNWLIYMAARDREDRQGQVYSAFRLPQRCCFSSAFCTFFTLFVPSVAIKYDSLVQVVSCSYKDNMKHHAQILMGDLRELGCGFFFQSRRQIEKKTSRKQGKRPICFLRYPQK